MEDREKAVKEYNRLKEKYGLPELSELEKNFDFLLRETSGIIRNLTLNIWEVIHRVKSAIESILQPQRYCCIIETKFFNNKEKQELFDVYSRILEKQWLVENFFYESESSRASLLKQSYEFFKELKPVMSALTNKLSRNWKKKESKEEGPEYIT